MPNLRPDPLRAATMSAGPAAQVMGGRVGWMGCHLGQCHVLVEGCYPVFLGSLLGGGSFAVDPPPARFLPCPCTYNVAQCGCKASEQSVGRNCTHGNPLDVQLYWHTALCCMLQAQSQAGMGH